MGNDHRHDHSHDGESKGLTLALVINIVFTIIEIIGGFLTNSVAILSDAVHDLGDSAALALAWYFEKLGKRGRDSRHSYGYRRYHLLGSIINALVLVAGSVLIIVEAIKRIQHPEPVDAKGMIVLAVLGVIMNGFAFRKLHAGHSHNVEVMRLHLLEDVLGWAAVLVGAIVMLIWDIPVLDPIMSILISAFILWQVLKRLRQSVRLVMQTVPENIDLDAVQITLQKHPKVEELHDLHIWSMDGSYHILTVHVVLVETMSMDELVELKIALRNSLKELGIQHATFEFETADENCTMHEC